MMSRRRAEGAYALEQLLLRSDVILCHKAPLYGVLGDDFGAGV